MNERTKIQIVLENGLDAHLFAQQRALIIQLIEQAQSEQKRELLEGITNFLDVVAN